MGTKERTTERIANQLTGIRKTIIQSSKQITVYANYIAVLTKDRNSREEKVPELAKEAKRKRPNKHHKASTNPKI